MKVEQTCLVDADVFITAKNLYYAFDICPGFWKSLVQHHREGRIFSLDRVRSELLAGHKEEDLVRWVKNKVPRGFFVQVDVDAVVRAYTDIMMWVQRHPGYFDIAKAKFATGADGWIVACARVHGTTVVTSERSAPASRREVELPDACNQFEVRHDNSFAMLRALNVHCDWDGDD